MRSIFIVFPHQLFKDIGNLQTCQKIVLIEETLFFNQYKFHKQKLAYHRSTMKYYENYLTNNSLATEYIEATSQYSAIGKFLETVNTDTTIHYYDPVDDWLSGRIEAVCTLKKIQTKKYDTPLFINTNENIDQYFGSKKRYYQTDFYTLQRKKLQLLLEPDGKPVGGAWTYDTDNRQKYPKNKIPPVIQFPSQNSFDQEASLYINQNFAGNYGKLTKQKIYPTTHTEAEEWLDQFLDKRFTEFGPYEDAIVAQEHFLHHSLLTPLLNIGLLLPEQIIKKAIQYAENENVPLNSLEGFIRQIIGWREFIRGVYVHKGRQERTTNFWKFDRLMPQGFYDATTGIPPIDQTIKKILATGYSHHIERLMLLGNFMLLCEIDPDAVYQWFMEMYIDAYDWVMVPNVYGMSQFADGGLMATKPYISGSSYVLKMSDYPKGPWCEVWDALFWRFMDKHRTFFQKNPRLSMLVKNFDKMDLAKRTQLLQKAESFLVEFSTKK